MITRTFKAGKAHIVFHVGLARNERLKLAFGSDHRQHQHFGGGFGTGANYDVALIEADAHAHPETLVRFTIHAHVIVNGRTNLMPPYGKRTPGIIDFHPEHPFTVRGEACAADTIKVFG